MNVLDSICERVTGRPDLFDVRKGWGGRGEMDPETRKNGGGSPVPFASLFEYEEIFRRYRVRSPTVQDRRARVRFQEVWRYRRLSLACVVSMEGIAEGGRWGLWGLIVDEFQIRVRNA